MDRLGFLKRIGILAATSLIPDWAIADEKNLIPLGKGLKAKIDEQKFVNHMNIQRKSQHVTGQAMDFKYTPTTEDFKEYWEHQDYRFGVLSYKDGTYKRIDYGIK
jgi:hypothetical protein